MESRELLLLQNPNLPSYEPRSTVQSFWVRCNREIHLFVQNQSASGMATVQELQDGNKQTGEIE